MESFIELSCMTLPYMGGKDTIRRSSADTSRHLSNRSRPVEPLVFSDGVLRLLDQRRLPHTLAYVECTTATHVARAIREMVVRGAPLIGVAAAYGVALDGCAEESFAVLRESRPTARDLFSALEYMERSVQRGAEPLESAVEYHGSVLRRTERIGDAGVGLIVAGTRVLTHCNAGTLAVGGLGTATAPIYRAVELGREVFVWVSETRPWLQGARLTTFELMAAEVPCALICDSACGLLAVRGEIDMVIVGADRIAYNGDVINKIGTYEKALVASDNGLPFYVAAPETTFDSGLRSGGDVVIEERSEDEVLGFHGRSVAPEGCRARNPVFDITPARLITGYITEHGVLSLADLQEVMRSGSKCE